MSDSKCCMIYIRDVSCPSIQTVCCLVQEEHRVRQKILEELRAAGQADEDAEVKAKQAEAKRAALLYKLQQAEFSAGMSTPQPLGRQVGIWPPAL